MPLTLKEAQAVNEMAEILHPFLPGSGSSDWVGHVNFYTVAQKVGVGKFWQPGSKRPMIVALLTRTLEHQRSLFQPLIVEIVKAAMLYRQNRNNPLTFEEIQALNNSILAVGFKFPELWDPIFLYSLPKRGDGNKVKPEDKSEITPQQRTEELAQLKQALFDLQVSPNRNHAGLALEKLLNRLFALYSLAPRQPFRVVGEQIDGSFELDNQIYLIEAKWEKRPMPEADLLVFKGKIEGKSTMTRGVFIALNGISDEANRAITYGKELRFFVMNGHDLLMLLSEDMRLDDFLRRRRRFLDEEGRMTVSYGELNIG